ncbi:hypothetical protein [Peribacillus glennii]|uniref:hypothetical protein n=1 Tax=Peribacillus glennii TaxID=2303991 RepID=UPI001313FCB1|nr:hypothetical protein [Peribacillus glennii]
MTLFGVIRQASDANLANLEGYGSQIVTEDNLDIFLSKIKNTLSTLFLSKADVDSVFLMKKRMNN